MKHDRTKAKLAALDAARAGTSIEAIVAVRAALCDRSSLVVAKAAKIAASAAMTDVEAEVVAALHVMLADGADDPGAQAANALAEALRDAGHRDPAPFLAGLEHVRMEPVWGGRVDVAGPLRATCAQALVATDIEPHELLTLLVDRLADRDKWVRLDVARAIAQLDRPESTLLLRLKALGGDVDPEVVGQCLCSLLELEGDAALGFVARFLSDAVDDVVFEALGTLAQSKLFAAFTRIEQYWSDTIDPQRRAAVVKTLAASPHREAAAFLFDVLERNDGALGIAALESLAASRFRNEWRERISTAIARREIPALRRTFERSFD